MVLYIFILILGSIVYGVGAPSKTGMRGTHWILLTWIGVLTLIGGSILIWLKYGFTKAVIYLIVSFVLAILINKIKA